MRIKITSDSTCDLSQELLEQNQITLIPLWVVKENQVYRDGIDIQPIDIFRHVSNGGEPCSTSALNSEVYKEFFKPFSEEYDAVIHISIGSLFSSCCQNAALAAGQFKNVYVIDSCSLSTGQGLVVLHAQKISQSSTDLSALIDEINTFKSKVEISFILDRLDYMVKGGRCSSATALGANLLNLKPCIEVKDGKMTVVKKYRGSYSKCLHNYLNDRLAGRKDIDTDTLFITKTPVEQEALDTVISELCQHSHFAHEYWTDAGCTISCHCGPGTLGIVFARK